MVPRYLEKVYYYPIRSDTIVLFITSSQFLVHFSSKSFYEILMCVLSLFPHPLVYSSSSSSSSPPPAAAAFCAMRRLFTRPGLPPPNGEFNAKSMCFWVSTRTKNDGTLTICLPTLMCLCLIKIRAWCTDLAKPSLNTKVCNLLSKNSSAFNAST